MSLCTSEAQEGQTTGSLDLGSYELPNIDAENQTWLLCECSKQLAAKPPLQPVKNILNLNPHLTVGFLGFLSPYNV